MSDLPQLRGTPKQVKWANTIRTNTFMDKDSYGMAVLETAEKVDDATWWIANNTSSTKLVTIPKDPAPHQLVGGPSKADAHKERVQRALDEPRAGEDGDENDLPPGGVSPKPHDAELFAASVCRHPALAEIAVLATLARLYKGEVGDMLKWRARHKLEKVRETIIAEMDKDIDGLRRILK